MGAFCGGVHKIFLQWWINSYIYCWVTQGQNSHLLFFFSSEFFSLFAFHLFSLNRSPAVVFVLCLPCHPWWLAPCTHPVLNTLCVVMLRATVNYQEEMKSFTYISYRSLKDRFKLSYTLAILCFLFRPRSWAPWPSYWGWSASVGRVVRARWVSIIFLSPPHPHPIFTVYRLHSSLPPLSTVNSKHLIKFIHRIQIPAVNL